MSTKDDMIAAIQEVADDPNPAPPNEPRGAAKIRAVLGAPGEFVEIADTKLKTGGGWDPSPAIYEKLVEGLAKYLDDSGIAEVAAIKSKVNELIGEFNKLLDDYNNAVVPSSASAVTPLP